jgi:cellulose synthase/poly-beta-1,6-N-acetylglucosamine synthase-like glycosyltransferase
VIADNCSDRTAEVARLPGAQVHERVDTERRGKGQALAWLLPQLLESASIDAFVFIDADSVVDGHFIEEISRLLGQHAALQASYRVLNPDTHALVTLRAIAFSLIHELRGRAKLRLNVSCGLWGNGMAFRRDVLEALPWQAFSGVEDAEQHLLLVLSGAKVRFVPGASVYGHMPATFAAAQSQQTRWEAGRLALLRRYWTRLLRASFTGNGSAAVALAELAIPPLSVVLLTGAIVTLVSLALAPVVLASLSLASLGGLFLYVLAALPLARLRPRAYLALIQAPRFILWKMQLYVREAQRRVDPAWTRTSRDHT